MPEGKMIEIKPAKGRPMLTWVGKRPLRNVLAYPAQLVETYSPPLPAHITPQPGLWADWPENFPKGGLLFHGDNKDVLAYLLANGFRGKVKLIYIDPPFDSGADYVRKVELHGVKGIPKLDGESYNLGEQIQYTDIWTNDSYLQFMYERLLLLRELLSDDGCIYLHCDYRKGQYLRCLMDEIFGSDHLLNEIIWKRTSARSDSKTFNHIHDVILFYSKGNDICFNQLYIPHSQEYIDRYFTYKEPGGRRFATIDATQSGITKNGESGKPWRGFDPASKGNHWKFAISELDRLDSIGRIYWPDKEGGWPRLKSYLDEQKGSAIQSIWIDVNVINSQADERGDYPTQKPESLLARIVQASSNIGDIVLDCFVGSGTSVSVAQKLGRRWIAADINKGSIQATTKRLQVNIEEQIQGSQSQPAHFNFSVYRVNDYDLQIQHNEALNLACEHIGITRTKTDGFFDGTLGKDLVKIIPFNHPLTLLDLQAIHDELHNRPTEERNVVVVCLGRELATYEWLEDWNQNRKKTSLPNQMRAIEVRSDPKYGGLFIHKPAEAEVSFQRTPEGIQVEILSFISPTIIERLRQQAGIVTPQIEDWRAMVDSVMIDTAYNGEVFNIVMADIPEKKSDLVAGKYLLPATEGPTNIAIKITDMLGEEVVICEQV
jgi:DNA modification methylase